MNTNEIIETLTAYNAWRRGDDSQPVQEPKKLGEALDGAVEAMRLLDVYQKTINRLDDMLEYSRASITREQYHDVLAKFTEEVRKC